MKPIAEITLFTDDVVLVEPRAYPWGRSAYLRDPDGRLVELAEEPS